MTDRSNPARLELEPDAWHEASNGGYYLDCPECGSAATLQSIVEHGRCTGYLDENQNDTEIDERTMDCSAKLSLELVYDSE